MISDKSGRKQVLYFGSSENIDPSMYELPPQAPELSFDVRFSSNRCVELLPEKLETMREFPIVAEASEYPLSITWDVNNDRVYTIRDAAGKRYPMENEGSLTVNKSGSRFTLEVKSLKSMPTEFSLTKNYPNPFNPITTILFNLPDKAVVTLKVTNILGQIVSTLLERTDLNSGLQQVEFNAEGLPSGIYFYTIVAELMNQTDASPKTLQTVKKMLLVK